MEERKLTGEEVSIIFHEYVKYIEPKQGKPFDFEEEIIVSESGEDKPDFTLRDLIGKTIEDHVPVKNPSPYSPSFYNALIFNDGDILLFKEWGDGECGHFDYLLYDSKKNEVLYSNRLLGIL